jgi:hypothetical protein
MSVERRVRRRLAQRRGVSLRHEPDGARGAVLARQVVGALPAARAGAEPGVARRHMDEHGLCGAARHVLERGRVHEQLPVVLVRGEIERHLVGSGRIGGECRRGRERGKTDSTE